MYLAEDADYSRYGASYREQHAFANCTSLEKVTLSENTFISRRIFYGCEKIHIYSSQTGNEITDWYNGITY